MNPSISVSYVKHLGEKRNQKDSARWRSSSRPSQTLHKNNNNMKTNITDNNSKINIQHIVPVPTDIYISTQTNIASLNIPIKLNETFWNVPVIDYNNPKIGIIKKQIKFNSSTIEELNDIQEKIKTEIY